MPERKFPMPTYLQPGSIGPVVDLVLRFLDPKATAEQPGPTGILLDGEFADTGTKVMIKWQTDRGLSADGGCGPQTRMAMQEEGFDLDDAAHKMDLNVGITAFVQPDGTTLYWAPYVQADMNRATVQTNLRRSRRGN